ncbi:MAG: glutamine-hydrolyzing carbamoyl-phosphate synthase small subunit [Bdellovibrionaceae bacterium]|nr:glutamine-hydrolyzing carbamoyl-phosphate synthase small subunit [Pseudobdellovibrionaceae bacterium]
MSRWPSALYLENGHLFLGTGFGAKQSRGGEVVFNTGMSGYQEIFTDPSYSNQIVTMTYPHIGNTGVNREDTESASLFLSGVVVRDYCEEPSNWRAHESLHKYLEKAGVPGITDVDTREITIRLRAEGAQRGVILSTEGLFKDAVVEKAKGLLQEVPSMEGLELVSSVSCKSAYEFEASSNAGKTILVYDFGVKTNILRHLKRRGFRVVVVPYNTTAEEVSARNPDAILLSNGPGDPSQVSEQVLQSLKALIGKYPIFAICMGHQLLSRALGMSTYKLKFGHHGVNHPVKDMRSGRILVTSQNHGFAIPMEEIEGNRDLELTHLSLNDKTVEGYASAGLKLQSIQFHPEAGPGPSDASYLFDNFMEHYLQ